MHEHILSGCRPEPLASYLKGLAMLRIVSEQVDSDAMGWWSSESFHLRTKLDRNELLAFFTDHYIPTPIIAPWNGGSGFYQNDDTSSIDAILASEGPRFSSFKRVFEAIKGWSEAPRWYLTLHDVVSRLETAILDMRPGKSRKELESFLEKLHMGEHEIIPYLPRFSTDTWVLKDIEGFSRDKDLPTIQRKQIAAWWKDVGKARNKCSMLDRGEGKEALLAACRSRLPAESIAWFDAAIAIKVDGAPAYNPVLGSGGNEGRLDYTNNYMQGLVDLLIHGDRDRAVVFLNSALFGLPQDGQVKASIGQFDPGRAGGFNQGPGIEHKNFTINPWDFILMMEGTPVLASAVVKRQRHGHGPFAAIPFTVGFSSVGFSSSADGDDGRAETWFPLWGQPTSFREIRYVFGEGRSQVGRRSAENGLDFVRAVGSLGVDRGINEFVRFSFLKRRGDSYVALPAGRHLVRLKPAIRLLDELDPALNTIDRFLRGFKNHPSASFASARRRIDQEMFAYCEQPTALRFSTLIRALGRMEQLIATRDRKKEPQVQRPLGGLSPDWIAQADDGSADVRLAAALASIHAIGKVGPIRSNLAGVDEHSSWKWAVGHGQRHWIGSNLSERLGGVLQRRLMDAKRGNVTSAPVAAYLPIEALDVIPFLLGQTHDHALEELLWGFTLIDWKKPGLDKLRSQWRDITRDTHRSLPIPRGWALLKLLFSPWRPHGEAVRMEPRVISLLQAGRVQEACDIVWQRLRVSGLRPVAVRFESNIDHQRLLASLLVPVADNNVLADLVLQPTESRH